MHLFEVLLLSVASRISGDPRPLFRQALTSPLLLPVFPVFSCMFSRFGAILFFLFLETPLVLWILSLASMLFAMPWNEPCEPKEAITAVCGGNHFNVSNSRVGVNSFVCHFSTHSNGILLFFLNQPSGSSKVKQCLISLHDIVASGDEVYHGERATLDNKPNITGVIVRTMLDA